MNRSAHLLQGVVFLVVAVVCFAVYDTITKVLSTSAPLIMLIWFRFMFQTIATTVMLYPTQGRELLRTKRPGLQLLRAGLLLLVSVFAFFSLRHMPVADYTAIIMLTPLAITMLATGLLGERVSFTRWIFLFGGFAGAMIVIRPGSDSFNWAMLLPLALVAVNSGFQILTGKLAKVEDAGTMQFYTGCIGAGLASLALPFAWQSLSWELWGLLALVGIFSTLGHLLLILAYNRAPATALTPYLYLQIGFAVLGGWLVFSDTPDRWAVIGIGIIVLCGAGGTWLMAREEAQSVPIDPFFNPATKRPAEETRKL